jgi:hypothetical protein
MKMGAVAVSIFVNKSIASPKLLPQVSSIAGRELQTAGRPGCCHSPQQWSGLRCMQRTPAGLPLGMPGMGDEMDGAIQQAPQPLRQGMAVWVCMAAILYVR